MSDSPDSQGCYKIKTIASLAGVSPSLLRAWERRYQLFSPSRQAGNQRLYSPDDLAVLRQIQVHLGRGLSIGEVAALGRDRLLQTAGSAPERVFVPSPPAQESPGQRYVGRDLGVTLNRLSASDVVTIHRLYGVVKGVYELWTYTQGQVALDLLLRRMERLDDPEFVLELRSLGATTIDKEPLVLSALSDAKRGAISHLLSLRQKPQSATSPLLTLARDHAKLMRNAFFDLDGPLRSADEARKVHELGPFLDKVRHLNSRASVQADYHGPITCCCLETSTLDRVLYEFSHRTHFATDSSAELTVTRVGDLTRWSWVHASELNPRFSPQDLSCLAVGSALGVTPEEALSQEFLGTSHSDRKSCSWFHWPVYTPQPGDLACQCEPF